MADKTYPTFQIVEFMGHSTLCGRNCGIDVPLGNIFTQIVQQDFIKLAPHFPKLRETILADDLVIELKTIQIASQSFDILPSGYTAKLELTGVDARKLYSFRKVLSMGSYLAIETPQKGSKTANC